MYGLLSYAPCGEGMICQAEQGWLSLAAGLSGKILMDRSKMILSEIILCGENLVNLMEQRQFTAEQERH